jgi:hypothetical protein
MNKAIDTELEGMMKQKQTTKMNNAFVKSVLLL